MVNSLQELQQRRQKTKRDKTIADVIKKTGLNKKQIKEIGKVLLNKDVRHITDISKFLGLFGKDLNGYFENGGKNEDDNETETEGNKGS